MQKLFLSILLVVLPPSNAGEIQDEVESIYKPPEQSREELYQDLFISLLMPKIEAQINTYYKDYLTYLPMVYPYQVYIEKAERLMHYRSFYFDVIVIVTPVVGPHVGVGLDRLEFRIGGSGDVELKKFEHIKDYELPENWKDIIKDEKKKESRF